MQSLVKTRSDHSASQLQSAASTILTLKEEKAKSEERIAELERDVRVANEKAEEMEDMYMAVAFADEGEEEEEDKQEEEEEERSGEDSSKTSWLLKQVVAMSKMGRKEAGSGTTVGGSGADEDESEGEDEDEDNENEEDKEDEEEYEGEEQEKKIHDENEDLFKDMMGRPWGAPKN